MSTTIDSRVVEMRFDNKHFESNVSTTMSTLDKLKEKLGFKGATKGLEDISTSAKRVDLAPLSNSVEQVGLKFNGLYTIADQALRNITNSAMRTGKQLLSSLSVDQITAGWNKYDQKTANVQTLVNATGLSIDEVNSYLEKLMWFSDETSYAFTDMTAGLATMVSSGGDIKKLVPLLMGVANATAFAGKGAAEFSRVLQYGVNQAYSLGYMQVQDWKTIEGATVNSKQLMQTLIDAGVALKKIEKGEITTGTFRNSLKDKWLTKEVMERGFGQFAEMSEKAYEMVNSGEVETASQAYEILSEKYDTVSLTAAKAAQEAKTFTEAIDATKDAVSSGWMKTFELIFGNYEQAKKLWTDLANTLWDVFAAGAEVRNWVIDTALNFAKPWEEIAKKLGKVSGAIKKVTSVSKKFKKAGEAVEYYQKIVSSVWRGNWKRSDTGRYELLEKAGYDHRVVQDLVNLGSKHKITIEDIEASHKKFGLTLETSTEETKALTDAINNLTDEQLKELGLTEDEIEIYKELAKEAERTGRSIEDIANEMAENDGRTLLIDGFKNLGSTLLGIFTAIKNAWAEIFPPMSFVQVYNMVKAFNQFTEKLRLTDKETGELNETGKKFQRIFAGVFAIIDVISTIMGGVFKIAWRLAGKVLDAFGMSVLDLLAWVGDLAVKFRDWFDSVLDIDTLLENIVPIIKSVIDAIVSLFSAIKNSRTFSILMDGIQHIAGFLGGVLVGVLQLIAEALDYVVNAIKNWLAAISQTEGFKKFVEYATKFFTWLENTFGTVVKEIGTWLFNLFNAAVSEAGEALKKAYDAVVKWHSALAKNKTYAEIVGYLKSIYSWLKDKILLAFSKVTDVIKNAKSAVSEWIDAVKNSKVFQAGQDTVSGFVIGLKNGVKRVWNAAVELARAALEGICNFLGIRSPAEKTIEAGEFTAEGFWIGLLEKIKEFDWTKIGNAIWRVSTFFPGSNLIKLLAVAADFIALFLGKIINAIKDSEFSEKAADICSGLINGLKAGAGKIFDTVVNIAQGIIDWFCKVLGIRSPSVVMFAIGGFLIAGAINGMKDGTFKLWQTIADIGTQMLNMFKSVFGKVIDFISNIDIGTVIAAGFGVAILLLVKNLIDALKGVSKIGTAFANLTAAIKGFGKPSKMKNISKMITTIAIAFVALAGSLFLISKIPADRLWVSFGALSALVGVFIVLVGVMAGLEMALSKLPSDKGGIERVSILLLGIAGAIALITLAVHMIAKMNPDQAEQAFTGLAKIVGSIVALMVAFGLLLHGVVAENIDRAGGTLIKISIAMMLLVWVSKSIAKIPSDKLQKGLGGMLGFVGIIALLMLATRMVGNNADRIGGTMLKISIAMMILVMVAKSIAKIPGEDLVKGLAGMLAFVGIISLLMLATRLAGTDANKVGPALFGIAAAMLVLGLVVKLLGKMDTAALIKGTIAITAFSGIIVGLMAATKLAGGPAKVKAIGAAMLSIAGAIGILALVTALLGLVDIKILAKGIVVVGLLSGMVTMMIWATKDAKQCTGNLVMLGVIVALLAGAIVGLSFIDPKKLTTTSLALSAVMAAFALMIAATKNAKNTKEMLRTMWNMVAIVAVLTGLVVALAFIPAESALPNTAALSLLMLSFAGALFIMGKAGKISTTVSKQLLPMTLVVAGLAVILGILAALNVEASIPTAIALGILLNSIASALLIMGTAGRISTTVSKQLLPMTLVVAGLAVILGILAALNVEASIPTAIALGILLNSMASALLIASLAGPTATGAATAMFIMTGVVIGIGAMLGTMAAMNVEASIPTAIALGILLNAMASALLIASLAGPTATTAATAMFIMAGAVVGIGAILGIMAAFDIEPSLETALALSTILLAMSAACVIASLAPATAAISGALGLAAFIGIMAGVVAIAGGLSKIPGFNELLADGGETLALIGNALGRFVGSIVAGFTTEVMTILPQLGLCLSQFMIGAMPFIAGVKMVDMSVLEGVGILSGAILALTAADLVAGVASFLQGGSSFAQLGAELSAFMINALPFITTAMLITPEMLAGVRALADTILILTAAELLEGLTSFITGGSSLETFAQQLPLLGQGIAAFATSLGAFTPEQLETINCAAQAIKTLAQASAAIPNSGGLLAQIVGENDLGTFAAQFPILGSGLRAFLDNVGTFSDEQVATVNCAAQAIKTLAQASSEIPNSGGWLAQIVGENDLGVFAAQFPILGTGLRGFLDNVGTFTDEQVATVNCAATAIKSLAEASSQIPNSGGWLGQIVGENGLGTFSEQFPTLGTGLRGFLDNIGTFSEAEVTTVNSAANAIKSLATASSQIPNTGGWLAKIVGDNTLDGFAKELPNVGKGIKGFVDELGTFTAAQVSTVSSAVAAVKALTGLANADLKGASKNLGNFGEEIIEFASDLTSFCSNMPSSGSMDSAVSTLDKLLAAVKSIANANSGALATFATNLKKVGEDAVKKFVGAFTSASAKTDLKSAATTLAGEAVSGAKTKYESMKGAGSHLVDGFAAGITANTWKAEAKAKAMADAAEKAAKEALDINSPSKVFRAIGYSVPEGFAMGIDKMGRMVTNSSTNMANSAIDLVGRSISNISKMISTDIDAQPTIRPVLDLSDVRSGASALGSMLDMDSTVGVRANIGAISSMMATRSQNGANADVVSAIDKLNKRMDNLGNTTYQINGITYDDGSNITDAVATLVRAAKIERRV